MINWKSFFDNTSTTESLINFVEGTSFKKAFYKIKFPIEVADQLIKIKDLTEDVARKLAKQALERHL